MGDEGDCRGVRELFLALEEGVLGADEARAVREHLAACEECRRAWEAWQADDQALRKAMGPVAAPRDVAGAALAQLRAEARGRPTVRRRAVVRWVAAAAAVVLVGVGVMAYRAGRYERTGEVAEAVGQPRARQRGAGEASAVGASAAVYDGAELATGAADGLTVAFADGSRLVLSEGTNVKLSGSRHYRDCGHHLPHVCLLHGEVVCELKSLRYFRGVGTPLGTAVVEGTRFRMKYVRGQRTVLEVLEGVVRFSCPGGEVSAPAGTTWVTDSQGLMPRRVSGVFD